HAVILCCFLLWLTNQSKGFSTVFLSLVSISMLSLNLAMHAGYGKQKNVMLFKAYNLYHYIPDYDKIVSEKKLESENYIEHLQLPDSILRLIGKSTVDVYPWNYAIVARNHLNWQPRPVLDSYASYTSWLDGLNSKHFENAETAPRFVI